MTTTPQVDEMLPCPFCGGEAKWREDDGSIGIPFGLVVDHHRGCSLVEPNFAKAKTIAAWNTRAIANNTDGERG
jgi:phage/plasmid primase-like uncharacterized protein